jgi:2-C-methyl-D-erythritol 2,4-cyclodiphosphate synthase
MSDFRIGIGFDTHKFASITEGRELWLAGIFWEGEIGLLGHSDGDVVSHAIADALLSAAGLPDMGKIFGVDDPTYKGVRGTKLLNMVFEKLSENGFTISNVSVQVIANQPKISPRKEEIEKVLSDALGGARVTVSATTTDGLGFTGSGKGVAAIANALIHTN